MMKTTHSATAPSSERLIDISGLVATAVVCILGLYQLFLEDSAWRWPALALGLAAVLLLILAQNAPELRLSWRRLLLAAQTAVATGLLLIPPHIDTFIILFFVLSVTAALIFEPREWVWWILLFTLITILHLVSQYGWRNGLQASLIYGAAYFFFAAFAKATNDARVAHAESQRLYRQLQQAHDELKTYAATAEELAIVQERQRLAREMHDTVGHRLTVAAVQLEAARQLISRDPDRAAQMADTVHQQITRALTELRQIVATLRAPVEEDLSLPQALQRLAATFQQATGLPVQLALPTELPPLPASYRTAFHRAAQECLTNVQKHAEARQVWITLTYTGDALSLQVADDGRGLAQDVPRQGFGLRGLQERATQLGGDFHLLARPQGGLLAEFSAPCPPTSLPNTAS